MKFNFPFFGFPSFGKHYAYSTKFNNSGNLLPDNTAKEKNKSPEADDLFYIDIFGIKLHQDDLLLIGLLFFLYEEEVDDTSLFIALILLLLS